MMPPLNVLLSKFLALVWIDKSHLVFLLQTTFTDRVRLGIRKPPEWRSVAD